MQSSFAFFAVFSLFCLPLAIYGQNRLSTPLEILTFMQASPTQYKVEQLRRQPEQPNLIVLNNDSYVIVFGGKEYSRAYPHSRNCKAEKAVQKANEILFSAPEEREKARKLYKKALREQPADAQLYSLIGETYFEEKNYEKAIPNLRAAIQLNSVDYRSRWLLGEIFLAENQCDSAMYYLTLAHLYNRNLPRLQNRLKDVYAKCGKSYYNTWRFEPRYFNYREDSFVIVSADGIWLTYAMYKAVWEFEPDYLYIKSKQQVADYLYHQELEAMLGTYMTYSQLPEADQRPYASIRAFELALDHELLEAYIFYEILLPQRPTMAHYLTPEFTQMLMEYIQIVRAENHQ